MKQQEIERKFLVKGDGVAVEKGSSSARAT